jgi:hypothetical protein
LEQQFANVPRLARELDAKFENNEDVLARLANGFPVELLGAPSATADYFRARPALLGSFDRLLVFAPTGDLIADFPTLPSRAPLSIADQPGLARVQFTRGPVISGPAVDAALGEPAVQILVPIFDRQKQIAGILVGLLRIQNRILLGDLAKPGKSGAFLLITKEAQPRYVLHPDPPMILQPRPANGAASTTRAIHGFEGSAEDFTSTGFHGLYSFKSLKPVDWLLVAVVPIEEAFFPSVKPSDATG